jgi:hypothetical protein
VSGAWTHLPRVSLVSPPGQLSSDLLLLAIDPRSGRIRAHGLLAFGLMAAELIELAALGRVRVEDDRIVLTDSPEPATGDDDLDAALASIGSTRRPPKPATWVGRPRRHIIDSYLARMSAAGIVGRSPGIRARWQILDLAGAATTRSRLDTIASGSGPVNSSQAALGGLCHAIELDRVLYPGLGNRQLRKRLRLIAKGDWAAAPAGDAAERAGLAAGQDAVNAATLAAVRAATQAALRAAASAAASTGVVSG